MFRSGFIAIVGRPNAGKSTLLNALLGEKIAIVSPKPQTTRTIIRGIKTSVDSQMIFVDTPGIHKGTSLLNASLVAGARAALKDADAIVYLFDVASKPHEDDEIIMETLKKLRSPIVLALNKVDKLEKKLLLPMIDGFSKRMNLAAIVPVSALKRTGLDALVHALSGLLPEGPRYFPDDQLTDSTERSIASAIIMEKVFLNTSKEIPYSVAVTIDKFEEKKSKGVVAITATINVERDSQKGIVIGKGGSMLKRIGTSARLDMERMLAKKVFLELFVSVRKDWTKKPGALKEFGY
ncbi:MAG: GTPase Era [Deltaproteobacteria bacterium]|nr:GTPase Era [Deltaproteobacteria bacterium]